MKILNSEFEDYHLHSSNYSDGLNTIDEIAEFAGRFGLKKILITDHSQATLDHYKFSFKAFRTITERWKNIHNDVDVSFGVEADLLNPAGDICDHIDGLKGKFIVLSYHADVYQGSKDMVAEGFINAFKRFGNKINVVGHICAGISTEAAEKVITSANEHKIPVELNAKYFLRSPKDWDVLLKTAEQIYINSDAHTLHELKTLRREARAFLQSNGHKL
jgi:histidinol phosphatase-like PHP family hydrolase